MEKICNVAVEVYEITASEISDFVTAKFQHAFEEVKKTHPNSNPLIFKAIPCKIDTDFYPIWATLTEDAICNIEFSEKMEVMPEIAQVFQEFCYTNEDIQRLFKQQKLTYPLLEYFQKNITPYIQYETNGNSRRMVCLLDPARIAFSMLKLKMGESICIAANVARVDKNEMNWIYTVNIISTPNVSRLSVFTLIYRRIREYDITAPFIDRIKRSINTNTLKD